MTHRTNIVFQGLWLALVTPMQGGRVDKTALTSLVRRAVLDGVTGLVACGSTGEAAMLDPDEQDQVLSCALAAAAGRPVLMGLAGVRPQQVAAQAQRLAQAHPGVAGYLLTAPAYVKPSQAGIVDSFHQVAEASPRPLVAYDIPARTGVRIQPASLLALADHPNIVALKDCSGDRETAEAVLADGRLALLGGNDDEMFDQLARGAAGSICASAHLATPAFVRLHQLVAEQALQAARQLWRTLAPVARAAFEEPNPSVIKGALALQGRLHAELRAPMQPCLPGSAQALCAAADAAMAALALVD